MNPGLDSSNFRDLKSLDDGKLPIVLLNCNLERLSFLDKLGAADYLNGFQPAYYMKRASNGFLFRAYPREWELYTILQGKQMDLLESRQARYSFLEAEKKIKAAMNAAYR